MHLGSHHAENDVNMPNVIWMDDENFLLDGKPFSLPKFRKALRLLISKARFLLEGRVMLNFLPDELLPKLDIILDNLQSTRNNYSFLEDDANGFSGVALKLGEMIMESHRWGPIYGHVEGNGKWVWNREVVAEWLGYLEDFKRLLYFLVHCVCGLPPRGTEESDTLVVNTPTAQRHLYVVNNTVCFIHSYNKTSSSTGRDKLIPRGLPEDVGKLLIAYLALVRPLERAMVADTVDEKTLALYGTHLWVSTRGKWDTNFFSDILSRNFRSAVGQDLSIIAWRHAAVAIVKRHLHKQLDRQPEIQQDILELASVEQAGHSHKTSIANYAIEPTGLVNFSERKIKLFLKVSPAHTDFLSDALSAELALPIGIGVETAASRGSERIDVSGSKREHADST